MIKRVRLLLAIVVGAALSLTALPAQGAGQPPVANTSAAAVAAADTGNRDNCRGWVESMYTSGGNVVARYNIRCDRVQSEIRVTADVIRHASGLTTGRASQTCTNTVQCSVYPKVANPSGTQLFTGSAFSAISTRAGHRVGCGVAEWPGVIHGIMPCGVKEARF